MIPLEQIYNYILNLANRRANVFFFQDWGRRGLDDCQYLVERSTRHLRYWPTIICHDQEMLDFDRYQDKNIQDQIQYQTAIKSSCLSDLNLRWINWNNVHDKFVLTHSEINSEQVIRYQNQGFETAYFWSHALIALDWYRYAQYDPRLKNIRQDLPLYDFLIYSRGWQGTREYRLKFADIVINKGIMSDCMYKFADKENDVSVMDYQAKNPIYHPADPVMILNHTDRCQVDATASATYDFDDFSHTGISVVLETNFDRPTIHLTEKILRPIALGHPFILASSPGCLGYLRSYGFETFHSAGIDETYDTISDPVERLQAIADVMATIAKKSPKEKRFFYKRVREIAARNRNWFFSAGFQQRIKQELDDNVLSALDRSLRSAHSRLWLEDLKIRRQIHGQEYHRTRVRQRPSFLLLSRAWRQNINRWCDPVFRSNQDRDR